MSTAGSVMPLEEAPKSSVSRMIGVFVSPGETFADIVRKPDFLAPLVVGILATIAFSEIMLAKIGMDRIVRMQLEQSGRMSQMTSDQVDQAVSQGAKFGSIITHAIGLLGAPIGILIIAAVGLGIANLIFGAKTKFGVAFAVTSYAGMISVLGAVVGILVMLFGDPEHFNPSAPVPTALAFFMDQAHTSKPLFALATSLDLFTFWYMAILGIGFAATTGGRSKPISVFLAFVAVWAVYVLAKVGIAAM